jgi:lysophospholipase L1-like esterase
MFITVDRLHLSRLYPDDYRAMNAEDYPNRIEAPRRAIQRIARAVGSLPRDRSFRILLVGSSQTWGAGARRREDTWASVLERELEAGGRNVVIVNAGISGARAEELLELYRRAWHRSDPDLVVIDLGHNDEGGPEFATALQGFVGECRWRSIPIVFVLEPNATEAPTRIGDRHEVMRGVAAGGRVPVVDMHAYLEEQRETGHIWWDRVHLTSYGQRLFGEELARELEPYLGRAHRTRRKGPRGS